VVELFGNDTMDGFTALSALDTNADGKIDFNDAAYDELLVWQDVNSDGISQSAELLSLADDLFIRELPTAPRGWRIENDAAYRQTLCALYQQETSTYRNFVGGPVQGTDHR
jgi:hypothetical protein